MRSKRRLPLKNWFISNRDFLIRQVHNASPIASSPALIQPPSLCELHHRVKRSVLPRQGLGGAAKRRGIQISFFDHQRLAARDEAYSLSAVRRLHFVHLRKTTLRFDSRPRQARLRPCCHWSPECRQQACWQRGVLCPNRALGAVFSETHAHQVTSDSLTAESLALIHPFSVGFTVE